ncbi:hypothetical protein R3P38DRAFT_2982546 [Favolaschia claudopus]|uniref:Uncharacterized protein n=1 Tax=Favolaschia claudopus TaxID=2862362 RepID=A0AAW0AYJ3_9AGAR
MPGPTNNKKNKKKQQKKDKSPPTQQDAMLNQPSALNQQPRTPESTRSIPNDQIQLGSLFLCLLPREMRDEIYSHLLLSTRLVSGERAHGRIDRRRIGSVPHALAILRTCRQVHAEIGRTWLQQILFSFETPEAMLNKLANIPLATRALIRHVRVSGDPLMLSWPEDSVYYRTHQVLKLLPGLALERLTVLAGRVPEVSYQTLDKLVRHSAGWKELRFLAFNSVFLGYKDEPLGFGGLDEDMYLRVPQPAAWQDVLDKRDGAGSGASVVIYRATSKQPCSVLLQPSSRAVFAQTLPAGKNLKTFGKMEDSKLMSPGERQKEVLVVVKRGDGVDYAEKEGSPYLASGDIREDMEGQTWKQFKADQDRRFHDDDDDLFSDLLEDEEDEPVEVEKYGHVDEYVWPPLHFEPLR